MASRLDLWLLSVLHPFLLKADATGGGGGGYINAIYSLGDSIADTGNAVLLTPSGGFSPFAYFPYGETLKKATGRCSDGLLMIDYFANAFKLPYLPPYLDKSANFDHGVNFAVAGATALDQSFFLKKGIMLPFTVSSLDVQLQWLKDHLKNSLCPKKEDCPKKLQRALFFVGEIGGNDYNYALMQGTPIEEVKAYVPQVVSKIMDAAKEVINVGAVQLVVPGNFPIGCIPGYLATYEDQKLQHDERNCLKDMNKFAEFHNQHLTKALEDLKKDHPDVTIIYADYYDTFLNIFDKADSYVQLPSDRELDDVRILIWHTPGGKWQPHAMICRYDGDCIAMLQKIAASISHSNYNFNANRVCGNPGVPVCSDPTKFISWDGIHLTQEAYKNIASQLLSNIEPLKEWKS